MPGELSNKREKSIYRLGTTSKIWHLPQTHVMITVLITTLPSDWLYSWWVFSVSWYLIFFLRMSPACSNEIEFRMTSVFFELLWYIKSISPTWLNSATFVLIGVFTSMRTYAFLWQVTSTDLTWITAWWKLSDSHSFLLEINIGLKNENSISLDCIMCMTHRRMLVARECVIQMRNELYAKLLRFGCYHVPLYTQVYLNSCISICLWNRKISYGYIQVTTRECFKRVMPVYLTCLFKAENWL